jgi:hypothetical protein
MAAEKAGSHVPRDKRDFCFSPATMALCSPHEATCLETPQEHSLERVCFPDGTIIQIAWEAEGGDLCSFKTASLICIKS